MLSWLRGLRVARTGSATAAPGGLANSGVLVVHTGPRVRSDYRETVLQIAPRQLHLREEELAELAAFCTDPNRGPYVWWRAGAWAGKSALMSWFVLHPPPGVRVASFFITARLAGQSDRTAFAEVLIEQLADLLGESLPAYLTNATRDAHLLALIREAARACERRGERLVLVVDGLDEDRGVTTGPDSYSIAALLPARLEAGMRVVVAGRLHPPIPSDVPSDHPLRDAAIVRVLSESRFAREIREEALHELERLRRGTRAEQELLSLVAAAGGGLSGPDLAELTGQELWEIEDRLHSVSGRTFASRPGRWRPGVGVYVLGHEELQKTAVELLGADLLDRHRQKLHLWADRQRARGWPQGTSEYLLRGYYRLLRETGDVPRMVACATDEARHDRMLDLTGGDTAAVAEVVGAQDAILARPDPDVVTMARLAVRHDALAQRNANIPSRLPAVRARLGQVTRAEALAGAISDPRERAQAMAGLVAVVAGTGDRDRAQALAGAIPDPHQRARATADVARASVQAGDSRRAGMLADRAASLVESISGRDRAAALGTVAAALAYAGHVDRAVALIATITNWTEEATALAEVAAAVASTGDFDGARGLADRAESVAAAIPLYDDRFVVLTAMAVILAPLGLDRARRLVEQAEALPPAYTGEDIQAGSLLHVAHAVASIGDIDRARALAGRAEALAGTMADSPMLAEPILVDVAEILMATGDRDRAESMAGKISRPHLRATALAGMATAAASMDVDLASRLADEAEALARTITDHARQTLAWTTLAQALARVGEVDRARALIDRCEPLLHVLDDEWDGLGRDDALELLATASAVAGDVERAEQLARRMSATDHARARLAVVVASTGDLDHAEAIVDSIGPSPQQISVLARVAAAAADRGDRDWARALAGRAEALTLTVHRSKAWGRELLDIASAWVAIGDLDRAVTIAGEITDHDWLPELATLAAKTAATGDLAKAAALAGRAETLALAADPPRDTNAILAAAWASAGDMERAEARIGEITALGQKVVAIAGMAAAVAATNRELARALSDRAVSAVHTIVDPMEQAFAAADLVVPLARAGDVDRAEALARSITVSPRGASMLASLAGYVPQARARQLVATSLRAGEWTEAVDALARIEPSALAAIADELLGPPGAASPPGRGRRGPEPPPPRRNC